MTDEAIKLRRFSRAVYDVAEKQVEDIVSQAKNIHDQQILEASRQGKELMEEKVRTGSADIKGKYVRLSAAEELESKRRILRHREALSEKVFENVKKQLEDFRNSDKYPEYLLKLVREIKSDSASGKGVIFISPADEKFREMILKEAGPGFTAELKRSVKMGGISAVCDNSNTLLDKTIDGAFQEQKELFRNTSAMQLK